MLISHRKKFIFTKTIKTAGTSVESYFERYCMPDGEWEQSHGRDEYISESGVIGRRSADPFGAMWYNHMAAEKIRGQVGLELWDRYFKFTIIRNPFDKLISGFLMFESYDKTNKKMTDVLNLFNIKNPTDRISGGTEVERFRYWVRAGGEIIDQDKYLIDGEECVDYFIRFESLYEDIKHVCDHLNIRLEPSLIPTFKRGIRRKELKVREYYDDETRKIVEGKYAWELGRFDYSMPK